MSQAPPKGADVIEAATYLGSGHYHYSPGPRPSAQNKATQEANFIDGSGPFFSMYMEMATEEDKKMAEGWKADADGTLVFIGLFSAVVASLISVSIQDILENPQETSNFYLSNIYRAIADPNISSSLPASPPPYSPPKYAVWVNALWFLSLVISLTSALLAMLLQRWVRGYLKVTQPRYSLHKRARIRAFFAEGVDKFLLPSAVEALPTMLHVSLFLFFAGLAVFLWNVNLTIFQLVLSWVGVCTTLYGCITLVPLFRHDSPYHTPLSLPIWYIVRGIPIVKFRVLRWFSTFSRLPYATYDRFWNFEQSSRKLLARGMQKIAEETALTLPSVIDTRSFLWMFDRLDEDHELERFFSVLPGFRGSKMVKDPLPNLTYDQREKLLNAWIGLSDRTFSSDLLPERVKSRRTVVCARAINPTDFPIEWVLRRIISEDQYGPVQSAEITCLVRGWDNSHDEETTSVMQALVSSVVARAQRRDDLWFALASDEMGMPESILRHHAAHGDSLSLAILIHVTRQQFSCFQEQYGLLEEFSKVLEAASKFKALDTSPELRHEFCALWNQIVRKVQEDDDRWMAFVSLGPIRNVYATLHEGTDSAPTQYSASTGNRDAILWDPSSYPLCNISAHHSDSTPHTHDVSASTAINRAVILDNIAPAPLSPDSAPYVPSSYVTVALHDSHSENRMDVPLLDNNIPASFHPTRHTAIENTPVPTTSSDPATAVGDRQDIETSVRTMLPTTSASSTFASFVSPTSAVSLQNTTDRLVRSDAPEIPSTASPGPVLDEITGTYPWPTSAPDLGTAEGSTMIGSRDNMDAPNPTSVDRPIQANTVAPDLSLQPLSPPPPPPLPSATDIVMAGPSEQAFDAERTWDELPHTSHG